MSNVIPSPMFRPAPQPPAPVHGRVSSRHKVHLKFRLHAAGLEGPIDCTVQNLSAFGARLRLPAGVQAPDEGLVLESVDDGRRCGARVIWREGRTLGVQLIDPE